VDGKVVAAVEQERLSRHKHAPRELPVEAARFCLEAGGLRPEDVDVIAYPWSFEALQAARWPVARRLFTRRPLKALRWLRSARRKQRKRVGKLPPTLKALGIDADRVTIDYVPHHLAHASSAVQASGFDDCVVASIDGTGERTTCLFGVAQGGKIDVVHQIHMPDSLGLFYASITDYLGFEIADGEYKVMGMASYGDASKADLSDLLVWKDGDIRVDLGYVWSPKRLRWSSDHTFGRKLVERFGPPRVGDEIDEPYVHIAAAAQRVLEQASVHLIEHHLGDALKRSRRLCLSGGVALNVVLNRVLMEHPLVDEIYVPPSPGDAGTSLGAATYAAFARGEAVEPLPHAYLGPAYDGDAIARELEALKIPYERVADPAVLGAELLARGEVVAWFQGRMEWGPRALGNRSILGNPGHAGTADDINARIKYRERWRPFCPSVLEEHAADFLGSKHPSPFMTLSYRMPDEWKTRTPEVVHIDGTSRPQVVSARTNPRYHRLISEFHQRTGLPVVINTSLNRRGEPMVESPKDALNMFFGSGLEHLVMEDVYVRKNALGGGATGS
jgi:carbamoyltransferase